MPHGFHMGDTIACHFDAACKPHEGHKGSKCGLSARLIIRPAGLIVHPAVPHPGPTPRSHTHIPQYHTQIRIESITSVGGGAGQQGLNVPSGTTHTSSTPGPNNCWRADISKQVWTTRGWRAGVDREQVWTKGRCRPTEGLGQVWTEDRCGSRTGVE